MSEHHTRAPDAAATDTRATGTGATGTGATDTGATGTGATDTRATDTRVTGIGATDTGGSTVEHALLIGVVATITVLLATAAEHYVNTLLPVTLNLP